MSLGVSTPARVSEVQLSWALATSIDWSCTNTFSDWFWFQEKCRAPKHYIIESECPALQEECQRRKPEGRQHWSQCSTNGGLSPAKTSAAEPPKQHQGIVALRDRSGPLIARY